MTADEFSQSEDGKAMASAHDHSHGRPPAACVDPVAEVCPYLPPAPCVRAMEDSAHASARRVLQTLLNVDIDDANSVERFQNRRRRDADLHGMMEKAISDTVWGAAKVAVAAMVVLAILHIKEILAWFGKP